MHASRQLLVLLRFRSHVFPALVVLAFNWPTQLFAWGERGHDLITRVAVRALHERLGPNNTLSPALVAKEHQLGHLSNVPDIVWRGMDEAVRSQNAPTHFVDTEFLSNRPLPASLPATISEAVKMAGEQCASAANRDHCAMQDTDSPGTAITPKIMDKVGTAPWRIDQLARGLENHWARLKKLQDGKADARLQQTEFDEAIKFAGLLSHFVGDLAQPLHTSKNYDGWDSGQGGVHAYFETDVVNELPLALDQEVLDVVLRQRPFDRLTKPAGKATTAMDTTLPLYRAWSLVADSFSQLSLILDLDRRNLISKSQRTKEGLKLPAKRKPAATSTKVCQSTITQRLATGADALANIWLTAWQNAGKPDLTPINSFTYFHAPEFLPAEYIAN